MSPPRLPIAGHKASLCIAILFALLSLSLMTPLLLWVLLLAGCAVLVRVALFCGWYQSAPSVRTVNLLAVLCALALAWFSTGLGLLLSMINLLVMACALKLMMMSRRQDFLQLFTAMLFLIGCGFIFAQSYASLFFYFALLGLALLSLYSAFAPSVSLVAASRALGVMFAQAAPIAILLFLIMPQLSPLWKMPTARSSSTGLSDQVTPGDIASLSQSDELAFTVTFTDSTPPPAQRYWRALTLEAFDGRTWSVSDARRDLMREQQKLGKAFSPDLSGPSVSYEVIAEPTGQRWLYAIDIAEPADRRSETAIWRAFNYQILAREPLMSKRAYQLRSFPDARLDQGHLRFDKLLNAQIPQSGSPRTRELVSRLRQQWPDDRQFADALMRYFATNPFRYTLNPAPMPVEPTDTFLFEEQAGFCSHYASAMAFALRLAGIPARLVTGYHGGEAIAPSVYTIRQYDAHAWVEAWIDNQGWVRFDPTSVVAPDRLTLGLQQALEASGESLTGSAFDGLYQFASFRQFRLFMANLDYLWSKWILGFDASAQQSLFELLLGKFTPLKLSLLLLGVVLLIVLLLLFYFLPLWRRSDIPADVAHYQRAVALVTAATSVKRGTRGPAEYLADVGPQLPDSARQTFARITHAFIAARYQPDGARQASLSRADIRHLRRALNSR
ncbi:transglutaminase TgpA family protein [Alteromonas sp. CYL-A6]|uniref:transglutaminase TgpA family protein n=1 Tax=Alteromonas nitratireducens TaxID=3390813 RepID=UPI0034A752FE